MSTLNPYATGKRIPKRLLLAAALAATPMFGPGDAAFAQEDPTPEGIYSFEVQLAPVCLHGSFPLSIETDEGTISGDAQLTTDVAGKVSGTVRLLGFDFEVSGKSKARDGVQSVKLTLKRDKKTVITLKGDLAGETFGGASKGRGEVATGKNTFTIDATGASATVARIVTDLAPGKRGKILGAGEVIVCGPPVPITAKAANGKKFKLTIKGSKFKWTGKAAEAFAPGVLLEWKGAGFGAKAEGTALPFIALDPPAMLVYQMAVNSYEEEEVITPNTVTSTPADAATYTVSPALPAGLLLDDRSGMISGAPDDPSAQTDYTVTVANAAGSQQAQLTITVTLARAYSLAAVSDTLTDEQIRHLLGRTHLGIKQEDIDEAVNKGLTQFVNDMMVFQANTQAETDAFPLLINDDDPAGFEGSFPSTTDCARWWQMLMMRTDQPFQEALAFFWHDHFALSTEVLGGSNRYYFVDYTNLLRRDGAGNFRDLLLAMSRDPAMLVYLNGDENRRGAPNENYAREFWELFSLGRDNGYTEADIVESARAFTGWRQRTDEDTGLSYMEFDLNRHDIEDKVIFGQYTIQGQNVTDDYEQMVDLTLAHGEVAEYICSKLFEWFAYDNPPDAVVDELAQVMRSNNYEIAPVLRAIFRSEAFYSPRAMHTQVKSPLDFAIGFIRTAGLELRVNSLDSNLDELGQRPSQPPVVDGWTSGVQWLSSQAMVQRTNHVDDVMDDTSTQTALGNDIADILPPLAERTAEAVVDRLAYLFVVDLSPEDRTDMIEYLNTERDNNGNVTSDPFDGSDPDHLDERVRGLLWMLAQHPSYHLR